MDRRQKLDFINAEILPQVNISHKVDIREILTLIDRWRIGKSGSIKMTAMVDDGFLYINNDPVGRIAPKLPKVAYNENAAYWEGRILSRQED